MRTTAHSLALVALLLGGCGADPMPLPTEAAVAALDREAQPPLYQLLYDGPLLPVQGAVAQRVRMLVWLRHMDLSRTQLLRLQQLRETIVERDARVREAEATVAARYGEAEAEIDRALWTALSSGVAVDDPQMNALTDQLRELRAGGTRERELLKVRLEGLRALLEAERPFLQTLTPRQEQLMADAVFFLRGQLDPIGNPGDFEELVGKIYEPGQYAVLTRGVGDLSHAPLDIGGLWQDDPSLPGHALHDARREVLLLLALSEPEMAPALQAAIDLNPEPAAP